MESPTKAKDNIKKKNYGKNRPSFLLGLLVILFVGVMYFEFINPKTHLIGVQGFWPYFLLSNAALFPIIIIAFYLAKFIESIFLHKFQTKSFITIATYFILFLITTQAIVELEDKIDSFATYGIVKNKIESVERITVMIDLWEGKNPPDNSLGLEKVQDGILETKENENPFGQAKDKIKKTENLIFATTSGNKTIKGKKTLHKIEDLKKSLAEDIQFLEKHLPLEHEHWSQFLKKANEKL